MVLFIYGAISMTWLCEMIERECISKEKGNVNVTIERDVVSM